MSAPARADAMAIARPMPLDPPLTNTRMPASEGEALLGVANVGLRGKGVGETAMPERRQQSNDATDTGNWLLVQVTGYAKPRDAHLTERRPEGSSH